MREDREKCTQEMLKARQPGVEELFLGQTVAVKGDVTFCVSGEFAGELKYRFKVMTRNETVLTYELLTSNEGAWKRHSNIKNFIEWLIVQR